MRAHFELLGVAPDGEALLDDGDGDGDRKAELFGAAMGLDVLGLYRQAARVAVGFGEMRRARCLFQLAGAGPAELVAACLMEGRAQACTEAVATL